MRKDIADLVRFIHTFCSHKHSVEEKTPFLCGDLKQELPLCHDCYSLANYSVSRIVTCHRKEAAGCRKCTVMCYNDEYRVKFKNVMQFSKMHYLLHGRLDYILRYFI
jgi:hypothetical protein